MKIPVQYSSPTYYCSREWDKETVCTRHQQQFHRCQVNPSFTWPLIIIYDTLFQTLKNVLKNL